MGTTEKDASGGTMEASSSPRENNVQDSIEVSPHPGRISENGAKDDALTHHGSPGGGAPVAVVDRTADGEQEEGGDSKWAAVHNRNVAGVLLFCFIDGGAYSIWNQQVMQVMIKQIGGDTAVGWMSAASGVAQMIAAMFAGFIGDKAKRETVLRAGALAGLFAVALTLGGVFTLSLAVFYVSQGLWGMYSGVVATGTEAIFADSVPTGKRAFVYNLKWMDQTLSSVVGLIVTIVLLVRLGNTWEMSAMKKTMVVGLLLHPLAMLTLCTLRDKYALKEDELETHSTSEAVAVVSVKVIGEEEDSDVHGVSRARKASSGSDDGTVHSPATTRRSITLSHIDSRSHLNHEDDRRADMEDDEGEEERAVRGGVATSASCDMSEKPLPLPSTTVHEMTERRPGERGGTTDHHHLATSPRASPTVQVAASSPRGTTVDLDTRPTYTTDANASEKAMIRYLQHQCDRDLETYHTQLRACTSAWERLTLRVRFYTHRQFTWEAVPYFVCLVDFLVAFGSGMTLRFLPLYFVEDYHTSPSTLMTATLLVCPLQALFSYMVQQAGDYYIGRLPATIVVRLAGTVLLLIMGVTHLPLAILLPIYVVRNALMNSTRGITRSVIMDAVKKENRAKWSAFESFSSFTWAGSATIGGYIAEAKGYQYTFTITAFFHFCSLAVLLPAAFGARPVDDMLINANRAQQAKKAELKRQRADTTAHADVTASPSAAAPAQRQQQHHHQRANEVTVENLHD